MKAITEMGATFVYQSYFDSARLGRAILPQTVANTIVDSTLRVAQVPGIGVALHPCSQSPVAIRFHGDRVDSAVVHLTPGQSMKVGPFTQFDWGLPFGWLGGGPVILYVLHTDEVEAGFAQSHSPIIFHRVRAIVEDGSGGPIAVPTAAAINWPLAFPWSNALRNDGAGNLTPQRSAPLFQVIPDVVLMQYRAALAAPLDLVIQFSNVDPFDLQSPPDQAAGYSNGLHLHPVTFPAVAAPIGPLASLAWLPQEVARMAGDFAEFHLLDPTNTVTGAFVDVVRYGRFM